MSQTADQMELREEDIRKHYPAALAMLDGFDHAPRIAKGPPRRWRLNAPLALVPAVRFARRRRRW